MNARDAPIVGSVRRHRMIRPTSRIREGGSRQNPASRHRAGRSNANQPSATCSSCPAPLVDFVRAVDPALPQKTPKTRRPRAPRWCGRRAVRDEAMELAPRRGSLPAGTGSGRRCEQAALLPRLAAAAREGGIAVNPVHGRRRLNRECRNAVHPAARCGGAGSRRAPGRIIALKSALPPRQHGSP